MIGPIIPLEEFLKLEKEEQVEKLKRWKMDYTLKDIREAWGFKHSAQYYMLLKKLRIYEQVVNKSDKFFPEQLMSGRGTGERGYGGVQPLQTASHPPRSDHFDYQLNLTMTGPELADKLERLAQFLRGEQKQIAIKLTLASSEEKRSEPESTEDKGEE
ncbi:hypothetical protein PA598K_06924 [Paenibacillus sp. 598K]|uniref:hypothetical protein n=1 Tax=Paenibacillus sp. 598K TaxID=1117987 RepID=UPI000FFAF307|nr:hypothetical protein [Paenibacillus sp. 598K]GBF78298.1 hypothetical protein PA598K_06924 [Paenibacillus sp. 598K]